MNIIIKNAMLFATLLILQLSVVFPTVAEENKTDTESELQTEEKIIISTDKSIKIEIKNTTLHEVLKEITKESKINFEVTENLLKEKISIQVKSPDWPGALKKLLSKYNYANSWRGNKLIKIFIFEHGTGRSMQLIPPGDLSHPGLEDIPSEIPENTESPAEEIIPLELINLPPPEMDGDRMIEIEAGIDDSESLDEPDPYQEQMDVEANEDEQKEPPRPENDFPLPDNLPGTMPE